MRRFFQATRGLPILAGWPVIGWLVLALLLPLAGVVHAAGSKPVADHAKVTLQLKWYHQFQFAGYYAALNQGFYRDEGLDATILEGGTGISALAMVTQGKAHFGIGDSDLLIHRIQGEPLVALAAIFQHSPYVIMSREDRQIRSPSDLIGARVMLSDDQGGIQLRAMLQREGIDPRRVNIIPQTWKLEDLVERRVDAMSAYATVEPAWMRERGIAPHVMRSVDYGVDFYGDIIFTTEAVLDRDPAGAAGFLRATRKGWEYAFAHQAEMVDAILAMPGVRQRGVTREKLLQEAHDMLPYVLPDVVEIGHLNPGRLEAIGRTLADLGMVRKDYSLSGFIYQPESDARAIMVRWVIGGSVGVLLVLSLVLLWNLQIRSRVRERTRALQQEIQRRAEIERQLKDSQEMVQLVFGTTAAGIVMNTPDGKLVMANPAYYATVGYTEAELRTMDTRELTHPDDRARYADLRGRLLAGELNSFTEEKRYVKKGGDTVWVRSTVSMVRGPDGTPTRVIAVTEDITARRETEDKLRQSEALLVIAGRTAHLGGWSLDLATRQLLWSDEVCLLHGVPAGSRPYLDDALAYSAPEWRDHIRAAFNLCISMGMPIDEELEIITTAQRRLWVRVVAQALRNERGQVHRVQGAYQDITERKLAQQNILQLNASLEDRVRRRTAELEAVNSELEAFSYSVSHDLRSPLNTIDGFSQLLERAAGKQLDDKSRHYLLRIKAGVQQMGALIEGLLSLAKVSRDRLHFERVDLSALALRAVQDCREREPLRQVQVSIQPDLVAHGDSLLLSVVMHNLIGNAWKFTARQEHAHIDIGCAQDALGETVYHVKDNGAGFDMTYVDKLFGTFQRLHSPTDFSGTGVGLATVQRIVVRHGGRVWASATTGGGAQFYFTLATVPTVD